MTNGWLLAQCQDAHLAGRRRQPAPQPTSTEQSIASWRWAHAKRVCRFFWARGNGAVGADTSQSSARGYATLHHAQGVCGQSMRDCDERTVEEEAVGVQGLQTEDQQVGCLRHINLGSIISPAGKGFE